MEQQPDNPEPQLPDGPVIGERACEACGHVQKLTPKNFPRVPGQQYALQHICKACFRAQRIKRRVEISEQNAALAFFNAKPPTRGGNNMPHPAELAESVYRMFGGVQGVANALAMTYYSSPPGGRIRANLLTQIMHLTNKAAELGGTKKPVNMMDDAELEAEIAKRIETAANAQRNLDYLESKGISMPALSVEDIRQAESISEYVRQPE